MNDNEVNLIFNKLDSWRLLPDYQLERRADIFFAIYLPLIFKECLNITSKIEVIPEFPVSKKICGLSNDNRSFKIDYMVITDTKVYLVELKTDMKSIKPEQKINMEKAASLGIQKLLEGLVSIAKVSRSKAKYQKLLGEFEKLEKQESDWIKKIKTVEVVYIQPKKGEADLENTIYFNDIADVLEEKPSFLSKRFSKSLREWVNNPNK